MNGTAVDSGAGTVAAVAKHELILTIARYLAFGAICVTVWDWLNCIKSEYARIWKGKWSIAKALYIFNRYWSLIVPGVTFWLVNAIMTPEECRSLFRLHVALPMWSTLASEAILALRTYVFLGGDKRLLAILLACFAGQVAFFIYVVVRGVVQVPIPGLVGACSASGASGSPVNLNIGYFVAPLVFDSFLTALTIAKAVQLRRNGLRSSSIHLFVREGLIYFLFIESLHIVNLAFFTQPYQPMQAIVAQPTIQLSSLLTCHLVLCLLKRKSAQEGNLFLYQTGFETEHDTPLAAAQFAMPVKVARLQRFEEKLPGAYVV